MSLKLRFDILIGLLLFLGLAADVGRMVYGAASRVRVEGENMIHITREFINSSLANLPEDFSPEVTLRQIAASLTNLRHVRVNFLKDARTFAVAPIPPDEERLVAPEWFYALVGARPSFVVLPAMKDGRHLGDFVIAGDPADEVNEVWQDVKTLGLTGGVIILVALWGASRIVARTLAPLENYAQALGRLTDGDYSVRAEPRGSVEFVGLCDKLNTLAESLGSLSASNRDLFQRLMSAQEEERKSIAHELHDEIGPHLFALRANATLVRIGVEEAGSPKLANRAGAVCGQVEALQETNKRILRRLRPPALDDLGLGAALRSLVEGWRDAQPDLRIDLSMPEGFDVVDASQRLVAYRLVQESLTNVFRHSAAQNAEVVLTAEGQGALRVIVEDDGAGLPQNKALGLGLVGMKERVRGLGGWVEIGRGAMGGCRVAAVIPQSAPRPADALHRD